MTNKPGALPIVEIAQPCAEEWEAMRGTSEQMRHCDRCGLDVHNLSALPPEAALAIMSRTGERNCIRFAHTGDSRPIPLEYRSVKQSRSRYGRRFWFGVSAIAGLAATAMSIFAWSRRAPQRTMVMGDMMVVPPIMPVAPNPAVAGAQSGTCPLPK